MAGQKEAVRDSVASSFTSILGPDQLSRRVAEEELKALEVTEEYGMVLTEMIAAQHTPVQYRQLASVVLKQYVETHWTRLSEKFQEPEVPQQSKSIIKELLPRGLADSQSKVRASVAYAISAIAHWDWPENWSDLFDQLALYLESGEPNVVHGTLRVLTEFCHDVTESQLEHVATAILPHLPKVIVQTEMYSVPTRTRAVHIYNLLAGIVANISMVYQDAARLVLCPSLDLYIQTFLDILSSSLPSNTDHGLRKEVLMTLCHMLRYFPQDIASHVMGVVTAVWNLLVSLTPEYVATVVASNEPVEELCDSDGEVIGQESSLFAVFEFVSALGESGAWQVLLVPVLSQLLDLLLLLMQITQQQCSLWMSSEDKFVEEDDNEFSYSVRLSALELIQGLLEEEELATPTYSALFSTISLRLASCSSAATSWKLAEACMLVGGVIKEGLRDGHLQFDVESWVCTHILPSITKDGYPLLNGRALLLAGKLSSFLSPSLLEQLLELVASGLLPGQKKVLRILSVKALYNFCEDLKSTEHIHLLKKWLPEYLSCLCELGSNCHEDVVFIIVDCLHIVAMVDMEKTAQVADKLVPLAASFFLQYCHDPGISSGVVDLFQALSGNPGCHGYLQSHVVPMVMDILTSTSDNLPLGLVAGVLEILVPMVRGCKVVGVVATPPVMIERVFPAVMERLLESTDSSILQNGGECVRAYVAVAAQELGEWHDQVGVSGLQYVLRVILHLLDPALPEFSASFVGKLILVFLKKVGRALGSDLGLLLKAVLSKLHNVDSLSVSQSLLTVVAQLLCTEMEETLLFLLGVPDLTGRPALNYVLQEWCSSHEFFFGCYETKLSTLALCHLLTHILSTGDQQLAEMTITEEVGPQDAKEGVRTRSQHAAMPMAQVEVRLPVKIVRLLLTDLSHHLYGDEEDEFDEEGDSMEATLGQLLAGGRAEGVAGGGDWDTEEDQDLADEPASRLNLLAHLQDYLTKLSKEPVFQPFRAHLTKQHIDVLAKLDTPPS